MGNKIKKNKEMGLHETKEFLHSEENHQNKDNLLNGRTYLPIHLIGA